MRAGHTALESAIFSLLWVSRCVMRPSPINGMCSPCMPARLITPSLQNLTKLLGDHAPGCCREQKIDNYFGRRIAIDASMHIYQFLVGALACISCASTVCLHSLAHTVDKGPPADGQVVVGRTGDQTLTSESGDVTRYTLDRRLIKL